MTDQSPIVPPCQEDPHHAQSEKAIAAAFEEAADLGAFLILDEANSVPRDRGAARHSWEITRVNEMLTWMERHPFPFACTTNAPELLDLATARRFLFKVRFLPMDEGQIAAAFFTAFGNEAPRSILKLELLTPGDFAVVARKAEILGERDPGSWRCGWRRRCQLSRRGKGSGWGFELKLNIWSDLMRTVADPNKTQAVLLSLPEIAAWQLNLDAERVGDRGPIRSELPALQRGAVWRPSQIETLWDSLVRGFPVGAFILAPYQQGFGRQPFKLDSGSRQLRGQPDYLLLDGQQRATAIAIGFLDIWSGIEGYDNGPALWVDLAPTADKNDDREFLFRLVTRSHPWGYRQNDPKKPLEYRDIRKAITYFRKVSGVAPCTRVAKLPLQSAWPLDAKCPMPFALLQNSVKMSDWRQHLWQRMQSMPMFNSEAKLKDGGSINDRWYSLLASGKKDDEAKKWEERIESLVYLIKNRLASARIPALVLPPDAEKEETATAARTDKVETLFIRVNSAGTTLEGEELIYSALKAVWPKAPQALEELQKGRQIVTPARLVSLLWRLWRSNEDDGRNRHAPGPPAIGEFRKALRDEKHRKSFELFVEETKKQKLLWDLLRWVRLDVSVPTKGDADSSKMDIKYQQEGESWRLPPSLATQLFGGDSGRDILFLAVAWLRRLKESGVAVAELTVKQRQRSLGFIVAMHWFAPRPSECAIRLWDQIAICPPHELGDFFNANRFQNLLLPNGDGNQIMLPIVPPDILGSVISQKVEARLSEPFQINDGFWRPGSRWAHFYDELAPEAFNRLNEPLREWLESLGFEAKEEKKGEANADEKAARSAKRATAWRQLLDKMWGHRPLVEYAQRTWIARQFPDFDPTLPGQMEDLNRPWDYDHIFPSGLLANSIPSVIREWQQSIGNLRAWPLELNRGDQAEAPATKLSTVDSETEAFGISKPEELRIASFIEESVEWCDWNGSAPTQAEYRFLAMTGVVNDERRRSLLRAITRRFHSIYREWYETLAIGDLTAMSPGN